MKFRLVKFPSWNEINGKIRNPRFTVGFVPHLCIPSLIGTCRVVVPQIRLHFPVNEAREAFFVCLEFLHAEMQAF
jgi:hypothetical protein